jgi:hypothetical protein
MMVKDGTKDKGRGLFAGMDIKKGTKLLTAEPQVVALASSCVRGVCAFCLKKIAIEDSKNGNGDKKGVGSANRKKNKKNRKKKQNKQETTGQQAKTETKQEPTSPSTSVSAGVGTQITLAEPSPENASTSSLSPPATTSISAKKEERVPSGCDSCGGCFYCSVSCQQQDAPFHEAECGFLVLNARRWKLRKRRAAQLAEEEKAKTKTKTKTQTKSKTNGKEGSTSITAKDKSDNIGTEKKSEGEGEIQESDDEFAFGGTDLQMARLVLRLRRYQQLNPNSARVHKVMARGDY